MPVRQPGGAVLATVLESIAIDEDLSSHERRERVQLHYRLMDQLT